MSETLNDELFVTHSMGGMLKFEKTGAYPDNLKISSFKYNKAWNVKVKDESKKGVLRLNKIVVYNYLFENDSFKVQSVENGMPVSDWVEINMLTVMAD